MIYESRAFDKGKIMATKTNWRQRVMSARWKVVKAVRATGKVVWRIEAQIYPTVSERIGQVDMDTAPSEGWGEDVASEIVGAHNDMLEAGEDARLAKVGQDREAKYRERGRQAAQRAEEAEARRVAQEPLRLDEADAASVVRLCGGDFERAGDWLGEDPAVVRQRVDAATQKVSPEDLETLRPRLGTLVKILRRQAGLSRAQLGDRAGTHAIAEFESHARVPTIATMGKIAGAVGFEFSIEGRGDDAVWTGTPGEIVRAARQAAGLRQADLAGLAGLGPARITETEMGRHQPSFGQLERMLEPCGVRMVYRFDPVKTAAGHSGQS